MYTHEYCLCIGPISCGEEIGIVLLVAFSGKNIKMFFIVDHSDIIENKYSFVIPCNQPVCFGKITHIYKYNYIIWNNTGSIVLLIFGCNVQQSLLQ